MGLGSMVCWGAWEVGCVGSRVGVVLCMRVEVHGVRVCGVLGCVGSGVHGK